MKRFMSYCSLAAIIFGLSTGASAQSSDNTAPIFGIKGALDLNLPGKWHGDAGSVKMFRHGFGGTLGAVCNIFLGNNFYLEPGASLFYDSYSYQGLVVAGDGSGYSESDPSLYKIGLRIPVVAGYTFSITETFGISVFTGPEVSYAFAGKIKLKDPQLLGGENMQLFGKGGEQRRIDCAWKVGVGFPTDNWFVSIDAAFGLTDLLQGGMTYHENRITFGVTRYF